MTNSQLSKLEQQACLEGLLLRIQVRRPLGIWALRLVVASSIDANKIKLLGEMKAWAYPGVNGLQLDTMQVRKGSSQCIGHLIWAATMAWALETTPCKKARLLAIHDDDLEHNKLIRYFRKRGFKIIKEVGSAPIDLPLRLVWGGAGSLMTADCVEVYRASVTLWDEFINSEGSRF